MKRFEVLQQITVLTNKYEVLAANSGELLAFAEQAKLKLREKISFFASSQKTDLLFTLRAEKVMDIHGRYLVEDAAGNLLGSFKKDFGKSLLVSTWSLQDVSGNVSFKFAEENLLLAILRRTSDFIPFVGDLINFFPYHFQITDNKSGIVVGRFAKTALIRDRYELSLADSAWESLDARVFMAMAIGLDALQSR